MISAVCPSMGVALTVRNIDRPAISACASTDKGSPAGLDMRRGEFACLRSVSDKEVSIGDSGMRLGWKSIPCQADIIPRRLARARLA